MLNRCAVRILVYWWKAWNRRGRMWNRRGRIEVVRERKLETRSRRRGIGLEIIKRKVMKDEARWKDEEARR